MNNNQWIESLAPVIAAIERASYQRGWNDAMTELNRARQEALHG